MNSVYPVNAGVNSCSAGVMLSKQQRKSIYATAFKSYEPAKARALAQKLEKEYGVKCVFGDNGFVAECIEKTTKVFSDLLGKQNLPTEVSYRVMGHPSTKASYDNVWNTVCINKDHDSTMYKDINSLKEAAREEQRIFLPDWSSSRHPAHPFVHEYSHCAHWKHLLQRNGYSDAEKVWKGLVGVQIPTAIGRLIARYKISDYAVGTRSSCDMCEFMAERMAQDVCNGLTDNMWTSYKDIDVGYDDIFNRRWSYRYSSPQSYIDYFTQQVWNGDIAGAEEVGREAGLYLARLDAAAVSVPVAKTRVATQSTLFEKIGEALYNFSTAINTRRDERNDLRLQKRYYE